MNTTHIHVDDVNRIAREAGKILMKYRGQVKAVFKSDQSPVTKADQESSDLIIQELKSLTPSIPVVSEEQDMKTNREIVRTSKTYWLTDPLDGTKSYIDGYDGFGVHIALIENGRPVLGAAFFPAQNGGQGKLYYGDARTGAWVKNGEEAPLRLKIKKTLSNSFKTAMGWRDIPWDEKCKPVRAVGGARLCITAEGQSELAQFNGSFSFWDVAAGHAILRAAGGEFIDMKTYKPIRYDSDSLITPPAYGGPSKALIKYLSKKI